MKSQPDYKIIDACLEKVVRPEKMMGAGPYWLYRSCTGWYWSTGEWPMPDTTQPDDSDALAVVEKAVRRWLYDDPNGWPVKIQPPTKEQPVFHAIGHRFFADHEDETTALCMLALRVVGEETKGDSDGG